MRKNYIVVTGGAGFIGSNLIKYLVDKTKFNIISLDNYSTGRKKNEIKNKRIKYIKSDTKNISKILNLVFFSINSTRFEPTKPAPPVIKIIFFTKKLSNFL